MFEIDFFGPPRMIHAVLPGMRKHHRGHIINISSICGLVPFASLGYYCGAKFAVEGLSECLAMEVGPLGIKVMLVEPSASCTDWAGRSANEARAEIADYAATARAVRRELRELRGKQPSDPVRAASEIIQAVEAPNPPLHLLLGKGALRLGREKLAALRRDFDTWQSVTIGADFPAGEPTKLVSGDPTWNKAAATG
jgi:NAD(P)-dependent dehydrogenase (short-subunit alcohol dehydrogenase family)